MAGTTDAGADALDPERETARRSVARILHASLDALDPTDRTIVELRHCEGWTASEIGTELGLPSATVRTRLRRALQRLRTSLDEHWDEQDRPWQWAILPAIRPAPAPIAAGGWLTLGIAAAIAGVLVAGLRDSPPDPTDLTPIPDATVNAGPASSREAWSQLRASVRAARARRFGALPRRPRTGAIDDEVDQAADALGGLFFEEAGKASKPALEALGRQAFETLEECARDNPSPAGVLTVRAHLIAEPDVGTVVESIDVERDTIGDPALLECVRESTYTYAFPNPSRALYLAHDFTVDMNTKQVAAAAVLPLDRLPEVLERYPEYLDALPSVLEQLPAIAAPMRKLIERDPTLRDRLPRFVELVADDEAPAR